MNVDDTTAARCNANFIFHGDALNPARGLMIGILIVTHGCLGQSLLDTSEIILAKQPENTMALSIDLTQNVDFLHEKIAEALDYLNNSDGVLVLTDMFGGTPSNLSYSFMEAGIVEVIAGINLPMLIQAVGWRKKKPLPVLAHDLEEFGKKSISLASNVLKGNKGSKVPSA